ncbi:MAG: S41 family peptidase [bacterium]|nr:S41 family peptidase [Candidatus Minthenecus merdequi]
MKRILFIFLAFVAHLTAMAQVYTTKTNSADKLTEHIDIYCSVLRELESGYVDTLNHRKLIKESLGHMLYSLDPYTQYIPSDDEEFLKRLKSGQYGGVGSIITLMDNKPYFSQPYEGKPAARAGIKAGDRILEIDGKDCLKLKLDEVSQMLRGKPGTTINVKVERIGQKKPLSFTFERESIKMPTITYWSEIAPKVGYIRIEDFIDRTAYEFKKALNELVQNKQIESLIIDLRGNGGGIVDQAVDIVSLFVPLDTKIVEMRGNHDSNMRTYHTQSAPLYPDMKLMVLVDENTASSSEILAGSLQDLDRAVIMGEQSFGKGVVQNIRELPHDNYMKMTVAKYYLPSGRCIQRIDSTLRKTYKTRNGREIEDGCGITPDSMIIDGVKITIADYMFVSNMYFKYANTFQSTHPTIAPLDQFVITDEMYDDFCKFVVDNNFSYTLQSEKYLKNLQDMVEQEGYKEISAEAFRLMQDALKPNVERDLKLFAEEIKQNLASEIVKRYYYEWGAFEIGLRHDIWIDKAVELINNDSEYKSLLK